MNPAPSGSPSVARSTGGSALTVPAPDGIQDGDYLVGFVVEQFAVAAHTPPSGWTQIGYTLADSVAQGQTNNLRYCHAFGLAVTDSDELPGSWTWTFPSARGRMVGVIIRVAGVDLADPIAGHSTTVNTSGTTTATLNGFTCDAAGALLVGLATAQITAGNSHTVTAVSGAAALYGQWTEPDTETTSGTRTPATVITETVDAGPTGTRTITWAGTTAQRGGHMLALRPAADGPPPDPEPAGLTPYVMAGGTPQRITPHVLVGGAGQPVEVHEARGGFTIDDLTGDTPFFVSHRGGSTVAGIPEMTLAAYANSVAAGYKALELSLARTSDGVWVASHDLTADRVCGTSGFTFLSETWAEAQTLRTTVGDLPLNRAEEVFEAYSDSYVFFVENKTGWPQYTEEVFDLMELYARPGSMVWKQWGPADEWEWGELAIARGFGSWQYFYAESSGLIAPRTSAATLLGMNHDASQSAWDDALDPGLPVIGHVCNSIGARDDALSKGASGIMSTTPALL